MFSVHDSRRSSAILASAYLMLHTLARIEIHLLNYLIPSFFPGF